MKKDLLKKLSENLPQNPDILGRDRLFNCAVLVLFVKKEDEYFLLFEKRANGIRQGGDICFPGGGFEKEVDKDFLDTALRETNEELGLSDKDIQIIGRLDTMVAPIGAIIEIFVGVIDFENYEKSLKIDKNEVEKILLISLNELQKYEAKEYNLRYMVHPTFVDEKGIEEILFPSQELGLPKKYHKPWGHNKHKVWVYKLHGEVIWGVTAVIINDLLKKF